MSVDRSLMSHLARIDSARSYVLVRVLLKERSAGFEEVFFDLTIGGHMRHTYQSQSADGNRIFNNST